MHLISYYGVWMNFTTVFGRLFPHQPYPVINDLLAIPCAEVEVSLYHIMALFRKLTIFAPMFIIIGIILFLFLVALPCGIIYLLFHIPKTLGHPKLGRWLGISASVLYGLFMLSFLFSMTGWVVFPKNKVRNLLKDSSIVLTDRFTITNHENIGFDIHGDTYESFTIEITSADKQRIINEIKSDPYTVVLSKEDREDHHYHSEFLHRACDVTEAPFYYDAPDEYLISVYESPQKKGYVGKYHWISLKKRSNELVLIDYWE